MILKNWKKSKKDVYQKLTKMFKISQKFEKVQKRCLPKVDKNV